MRDALATEPEHGRPLLPRLPDPPPCGSHTVQLLRTYAYRRRGYSFAPRGERSVARGYRKALRQARSLVYFEDQYLWSPHVAATFADALVAQPDLRLMAVVPLFPDLDGPIAMPPEVAGRLDALEVLRRAGGDRVAVYGAENHEGTPTYVHAKVCVVDDRWATVGSDNVSLRSWTFDSELTCAVIDEGDGVDGYPRQLRLALAREHLDLPEMDTPDRGEAADAGLCDAAKVFDAFARSASELDAWHDVLNFREPGITSAMDATRPGTAAPVKRSEVRPLEHFTVRSLAGLIAVIAAGTGFGLLLLLVRLRWNPLERLDHGAAASLNRLVADNTVLVAILKVISQLGGRPVLWWLVIVGAVGLLVRRQALLAAYLVVTGLGTLAMDPTLKLLVGRLRPVVSEPVASAPGNSFPSGHALGSTVAYGALLLVFLPAIPRRLRGVAIAGATTLVVVIGFTRVALGVHYVSDVIAGWLLGVAWLGVTAYAFRLLRREIGKPEARPADGLAPEAAPALVPARAGHPDHPWRVAAGLVVSWVLILGVVFGLGKLATRYVPAFDEAIPAWFARHRSPTWTPWSYVFSQAGNTHAILTVGLVAGPVAVMATRRWRPLVFLAVTMLGELTLFLVSANVLDRPRPHVTQLDGPLPTSSFPSGHVAATLCLYGAIAVLVWGRTRRWWRWIAVALAVAMPALVAVSRLYRGEHHPTDIGGGVLLALLWLAAAVFIVRPSADVRGEALDRAVARYRDREAARVTSRPVTG